MTPTLNDDDGEIMVVMKPNTIMLLMMSIMIMVILMAMIKVIFMAMTTLCQVLYLYNP